MGCRLTRLLVLPDVKADAGQDERPERDAEQGRGDRLEAVEVREVTMRVRHDQAHHDVDDEQDLPKMPRSMRPPAALRKPYPTALSDDAVAGGWLRS